LKTLSSKTGLLFWKPLLKLIGESVRLKAGDEHCFFNRSSGRVVAHIMLDTASKGLEISFQAGRFGIVPMKHHSRFGE